MTTRKPRAGYAPMSHEAWEARISYLCRRGLSAVTEGTGG
jgi:hypothetical protein